MTFNLHHKKFIAEFNSETGEVSAQTIFSYFQEDQIVWASYSGGQIIRGTLIGNVFDDRIEFVYQHINQQLEWPVMLSIKFNDRETKIEQHQSRPLNTLSNCGGGRRKVAELMRESVSIRLMTLRHHQQRCENLLFNHVADLRRRV